MVSEAENQIESEENGSPRPRKRDDMYSARMTELLCRNEMYVLVS
jgi:hypothetical protein